MIYTEDQLVKVNGVVLPGLVKSIEVKESAKIDEQEVEGSATKPKQATGYEDAKVNIELILDDTPTATKYQRLETVRALFAAAAVRPAADPHRQRGHGKARHRQGAIQGHHPQERGQKGSAHRLP
mgnify:CR=1 FL=1